MEQKDIKIGGLYNYIELGAKAIIEVIGKIGTDKVYIYPLSPDVEPPNSPWMVNISNITELDSMQRMEIATRTVPKPYYQYSEKEIGWIVELAISEYSRTGDISKGVEAGKMLVEEIRKLI